MRGWMRKAIGALMRSWQLNRWFERRLRDELAGHIDQQVVTALPGLPAPYEGLGAAGKGQAGRAALFVSARFRSGSTFLWRLFDALDEIAAYYEPLNPRRWHRPDSSGRVHDPSHHGVDDYRRNYDGLGHLDRYFHDAWSTHRLVMDARHEDRDLERFIAGLIEAAPAGRLPVLQFNRVDFRLPWLKSRFPQARIVQLVRHPRDNFLSSIDAALVTPEMRLADFAAHDRFLLLEWAADLSLCFPVLAVEDDAHPYLLFYLIWRLSQAAGAAHADLVIRYEDLCADPAGAVAAALSLVGMRLPDEAGPRLRALSLGPRPMRWPDYAPDSWFAALEAEAERRLARHFGARRR